MPGPLAVSGIVGSVFDKNISAKTERVNGVLTETVGSPGLLKLPSAGKGEY